MLKSLITEIIITVGIIVAFVGACEGSKHLNYYPKEAEVACAKLVSEGFGSVHYNGVQTFCSDGKPVF